MLGLFIVGMTRAGHGRPSPGSGSRGSAESQSRARLLDELWHKINAASLADLDILSVSDPSVSPSVHVKTLDFWNRDC